MTRLSFALILGGALAFSACAPGPRVVRVSETAEIARIDSLLATSPPRPVADSLAAERARRVQSREEKLSLAALVAAAIAVVPVVVYVVLRDLEE